MTNGNTNKKRLNKFVEAFCLSMCYSYFRLPKSARLRKSWFAPLIRPSTFFSTKTFLCCDRLTMKRHISFPISNFQLLTSNLYLLFPLFLYFPVLSLPFFWDDVANFQHLFGKTILQVWIDSKGFPYYRPFTFTVWYAMQKIFGATNTVPFHALNLIMLLALAWAVSKLAHKLTRDSLVAFIAGTLMGVFPFAALVVPLVASLFHLLVTLCAVLACLAILEFESTQQWRDKRERRRA